MEPDYREAMWDQAAGALLVEEAGGRVTDLDGLPLDFTPTSPAKHGTRRIQQGES
jgi:3'-phosphoadenosine 5'-phosphosulfate (PAPS) 3'-phosphatase